LELHSLVLAFIAASLALNIALVLQRRGKRALGYAGLLGADLLLCGIALWQGHRGLSFFLALAIFLALMVIPGVLGLLIRGAVRRGDFRAAMRFLDVRQLFQPGLGLDRERQMLASLSLVHQGRGDEAIRVAQKQLSEALDSSTRRLIVERLLALYVVEERMKEATELFEREGDVELLVRAPGIGPSIVRAYGAIGDFEQLTRCQSALEDSPLARDPALTPVLNAARLAFLAHFGRADELQRLLASDLPFMPGATGPRRALWFGIALYRAGEREQARRLWMDVGRQQDDPAASELARRRLRDDDDVTPPNPLSSEQRQVLELVLARASAVQDYATEGHPGGLLRQAPVTIALLVVISAVHVAILGLSPDRTPDIWTLLRFGGNYSLLSLHEQPWRLVSSIFLHVGWLHLLLNAYALLMLGRFTESVFGSWRLWLIFIGSGITGSLASARFGDGMLSVGASGAVFGLLGAALVGLAALKGKVPDAWRKRLMLTLLIVLGIQVAIGFRFKMIDNAAHLGGLAGGLLLAFLLKPLDRVAGALKWVVRGALVLLGLGFALVTLGSLSWAARSQKSDVLAAIPQHQVRDLGLQLDVPVHWYVLDRRKGLTLQDPLLSTQTLHVFMPELLPRTAKDSARKVAEQTAKQLIKQMQAEGRYRDVELMSQTPRRVGPAAKTAGSAQYAVELRVVIRHHTIYQTLYFKRQKDVLLTVRTQLTERHRMTYRPLLDKVALSVALAPKGAKRRLPKTKGAPLLDDNPRSHSTQGPDPFARQPGR
jgi:membrane associated rhomboid family serine protease